MYVCMCVKTPNSRIRPVYLEIKIRLKVADVADKRLRYVKCAF